MQNTARKQILFAKILSPQRDDALTKIIQIIIQYICKNTFFSNFDI